MRHEFGGQSVVVSGAAQGIGRATALMLADAGAHVVATDVDASGLDALRHPLVSTRAADLASAAGADALMDEAAAQTGHLDVVVNAAGGVCGQVGQPIETVDESSWRTITAANVDTSFWLARAAARVMRPKRYGRIVFVSSGAGLRASLTGIQAYAAAKHAVVGLARQLALELGRDGITVNAVAPGFVRSNPATERQWLALGPAGQARLLESIHTRRLGSADDVAHSIAFLAARESGWITGQVLSVDGGRA